MLVKVSVFIQLTKYNFGNVTVKHPKEGQGYKARSKSPHGVICRLGSLEKGKMFGRSIWNHHKGHRKLGHSHQWKKGWNVDL